MLVKTQPHGGNKGPHVNVGAALVMVPHYGGCCDDVLRMQLTQMFTHHVSFEEKSTLGLGIYYILIFLALEVYPSVELIKMQERSFLFKLIK